MASLSEFFLFFILWCFFCSVQLIFGFMNWGFDDAGPFSVSLSFFFPALSVLWSEILVYSAKFIITGGGNLFTKRELPLGNILFGLFDCAKPLFVKIEMFCNKNVATRFGFHPVYFFTPLAGRQPFQIPNNLVEVIVIDDDDDEKQEDEEEENAQQVPPAAIQNNNNNQNQNNNNQNNNNQNNNNNNPAELSDDFLLTPPQLLYNVIFRADLDDLDPLARLLLVSWGYYPVHHLLLLIAASYVCPFFSTFLVSLSVATMQVQVMTEAWIRNAFLSWQQVHSLAAFTALHNPAAASAKIRQSKKLHDKCKWFMFRTLLLQFSLAVGLSFFFGFCAYHVFIDGDLDKKLAANIKGSPLEKNVDFLRPPEVRCAKYHPALQTLRKIERTLFFGSDYTTWMLKKMYDYEEQQDEKNDAFCYNIQALSIDNSGHEDVEHEATTKKSRETDEATRLNFGKVVYEIPQRRETLQMSFVSRKNFDDVLVLLLVEFFGQALRAWIQFTESLLVVVFKLWHDFPSMGETKYFRIKLLHRGAIFVFALLVVFQLNGYRMLEFLTVMPLQSLDSSVLFPYYSSQNSNLIAHYPRPIHSCRGLYENILLAQNNDQKKLREFASSILRSSTSKFSLSAILCLNVGRGLHENIARLHSTSSSSTSPSSESRKYYDPTSGLTVTANINKNKKKGIQNKNVINPQQQQASKDRDRGPFPLFSQIIIATLAYVFFKALHLFVAWHDLLLSFNDLTPERFRAHVRERRMKIREQREADRRQRADVERVVQHAMIVLSRSASRARSENPQVVEEEGEGLRWSVSPPRLERSLSNVSNVSDVVDTQCLICLEEIDVKACRGVKIMHCGHFFHDICVGKSVLNGRYRCPVCRAAI